MGEDTEKTSCNKITKMRTKWLQSSEMSELLAQRTSWNLRFLFSPTWLDLKKSFLSFDLYHKPDKALQLPCIYCEEFHWLDAKQVVHG